MALQVCPARLWNIHREIYTGKYTSRAYLKYGEQKRPGILSPPLPLLQVYFPSKYRSFWVRASTDPQTNNAGNRKIVSFVFSWGYGPNLLFSSRGSTALEMINNSGRNSFSTSCLFCLLYLFHECRDKGRVFLGANSPSLRNWVTRLSNSTLICSKTTLKLYKEKQTWNFQTRNIG